MSTFLQKKVFKVKYLVKRVFSNGNTVNICIKQKRENLQNFFRCDSKTNLF